MKARKIITTMIMAVALAAIAMGFIGCKEKKSSQSSGQAVKYTCSMHPDVVQDKPGNCPKCGMALTEKR